MTGEDVSAATQLKDRRTQRGEPSAAASLYGLRDRYVGRLVVDRRLAGVGVVEDVLVTPREKSPRWIVVRLRRRFWQSSPVHVVYPIADLLSSAGDALQTGHTLAALRRQLDFRAEFLWPTEEHKPLSLSDYLSTLPAPTTSAPS
jgi:hypothetical protein